MNERAGKERHQRMYSNQIGYVLKNGQVMSILRFRLEVCVNNVIIFSISELFRHNLHSMGREPRGASRDAGG